MDVPVTGDIKEEQSDQRTRRLVKYRDEVHCDNSMTPRKVCKWMIKSVI
jgi:hypothetical protein